MNKPGCGLYTDAANVISVFYCQCLNLKKCSEHDFLFVWLHRSTNLCSYLYPEIILQSSVKIWYSLKLVVTYHAGCPRHASTSGSLCRLGISFVPVVCLLQWGHSSLQTSSSTSSMLLQCLNQSQSTIDSWHTSYQTRHYSPREMGHESPSPPLSSSHQISTGKY